MAHLVGNYTLYNYIMIQLFISRIACCTYIGCAGEALNGVETVKYLGMEEFEIDKFTAMLQSVDNTADIVAAADGGFMATILAGINACMLVIMYLGSEQMSQGFITVGKYSSI